MAFKAQSRSKPVKSKTKQTQKPLVVEDFIVPATAEIDDTIHTSSQVPSIEDLIGGPKNEEKPVELPPLPVDEVPKDISSQHVQPQMPASNSQDMRYSNPRENYSQDQGPYRYQQRRPYNAGGYNRGPYNRGGGYNRGPYNRGGGYGGGGFRREPPMRRDFTYTETGEGVTVDINVPTETVQGILDVMAEGHGFLRPKFTPSDRDVYISQSQIRRFLLRNGDMVQGQARQPKENERYWGLLKVEQVNQQSVESLSNRPKFDDLIAIYPNRQLKLESGQLPLSTRIIDLIAPIGFGQRALIVSPPKAGKTTILKDIAAGITANYPTVHLMAALIGERPEEVTDLSRSIKGEVLASNFDQSPTEQVRVAEVALDRAKRLVELGHDVVVLLDSVTRLARAYNMVVNPSGRTLSGGFDPAALYPAKKFLGAARCVEPAAGQVMGEGNEHVVPKTGGSLTVIGTALVETGSRMDDLIYEEFKGTGNMELHLSRILQERRIFPAIDLARSGTRHDELLVGEDTMKRIMTLRHMLSLLQDDERTLKVIEELKKSQSNDEFLERLSQGA